MAGGRSPEPPRMLRRILLRLVARDAWSRDFVAELDREYARVRERRGRRRAELWYAAQLVAPDTLRFVLLMRRRRAEARDHARGGGVGMGRRAKGSGLEGWARDFRQVVRGLAREPRFALFVTATLALGIAGNAAAFGVADRMLLQGPEGVRSPKELVRLLLHFDARPRRAPGAHGGMGPLPDGGGRTGAEHRLRRPHALPSRRAARGNPLGLPAAPGQHRERRLLPGSGRGSGGGPPVRRRRRRRGLGCGGDLARAVDVGLQRDR